MSTLLGRVIGLIMVCSQVNLASNWYTMIYVAGGLMVYAFCIHKDSYEMGYEQAGKDMIRIE